MANYDEVVSLINGNIYPHVARTADPLLVRPDMLSLMVGDIVYNARIKNGLGAKGFMIYVNGNGAPVYEKIATTNAEATSEFGIPFNASTGSSNVKDEGQYGVDGILKKKAKEWLDNLEKAIAKEPSDSAIKKAIDRMCWQLHYDITESHTNFPEVFANNDFADVQIDRYGATNWDGTTIKTSIEDNYTNISNSVSGGATTICGGSSLQLLSNAMSSAISTFDTNLNGSNSASTKETIKSALNTIGTKLVPDGNYYSISECLRDKYDNNTFSIARSLRDGGTSDVSVSNQIKLQKDSLHTDLGPSGSINSSLSTINTSVGNVKSSVDSVNTSVGAVNTSIGGVKGDTDTIVTRIGTYSTNNIMGCLTNIMEYTGTAKDRIGTLSDTNTVLGRLYNINGDTTDIKNNM